MRDLKRQLWRALRASWAYWLMAGTLLVASVQVVSAGNDFQSVDTCQDLLPGCIVAEPIEAANRQEHELAATMAPVAAGSLFTYRIVFQGNLESSTDKSQFTAQVAQTLADERGWARAGYVFNRVSDANQADFSLILVQAEHLDQVPGCSSQWSCRAGTSVYINEDRWNGATAAWNDAGGGLRDYRHMVVNHEVGHWLGHGHYSCSASPNNSAPVMQQQSINLQGCEFNPWPLQFEIAAVTLN